MYNTKCLCLKTAYNKSRYAVYMIQNYYWSQLDSLLHPTDVVVKFLEFELSVKQPPSLVIGVEPLNHRLVLVPRGLGASLRVPAIVARLVLVVPRH